MSIGAERPTSVNHNSAGAVQILASPNSYERRLTIEAEANVAGRMYL
jgi:hypothetical protein